jgi:hypothetical protein
MLAKLAAAALLAAFAATLFSLQLLAPPTGAAAPLDPTGAAARIFDAGAAASLEALAAATRL